MRHKCLKCQGFVELPDGHRLNVCSLCGAVQYKVTDSIGSLTEVARSRSAAPNGKSKKSGQLWLLLAGLVVLGGILYGISKPGYVKYVDASKNSYLASTSNSLADAKTNALSKIGVQASAFQREISNMPFTAYENLPPLAQRLQSIIESTEAIEVPSCLSRVKGLMMQSMLVGHGAVKLNHARGNGINDPGVVTQIHASSRLVAEATEEMHKLTC